MVDMVNTAERAMAPEINEQLELAKNHTDRNTVPGNRKKVFCSDGRTEASQSEGGIRLFGGDFGVLAAFAGAAESLGVKTDLKNLVERYDSFLDRPSNNRDSEFHIHSDDQGHGLGCGHIRIMMKNYPWAQELYDLIKFDKKTVDTELKGKHKEKGVLLVESEDKSINSVDTDTGEQWFVVDMGRAKKYLTELPDRLAYSNIPGELVWKTYQDQMNMTASEIAPNMPMFEVKFERNEPSLTHVGNTPSLS